MTDQLIILNRCNGYLGEGFLKFEDGYKKMTVAFKDTDRLKATLYTDGSCRPFENGSILRCNDVNKCDNCGIFLLNKEFACLILYFGDKDFIKKDFALKTGLKTVEQFNSAEVFANRRGESDNQNEPVKPDEHNEPNEQIDKEKIDAPNFPDFSTVLKDEPHSFWDVNKEEFMEIFNSSPEDECLSSLIPGSKWVKRENYVLGIIYDEYSSPMYICYGFSLPWSENPPENLEGYSQWIPKDCTRPRENGYWVVYVNAKTGERVR